MKTKSYRDELRTSIYNEFNKEDFHVHLRDIIADKHKRVTHSCSPEIITSNVSPKKSGDYYSLMPVEGSIIVYCAKKGSPLLGRLKKAYAQGDEQALQEISKKVDAIVSKREVISVKEVVDQLKEAPAYFDLAYEHKTLVSHVGLVNGIEFGSMILPWNGGELKDQDFKLVTYLKDFESSDFEVLLVKCRPVLSKIEQEALLQVPETQLNLNIGTAAASPAACLVIVVIFAAATAIAGCASFRNRLSELVLPADRIKKLGSIGSAAEMLSQRRMVFEAHGM